MTENLRKLEVIDELRPGSYFARTKAEKNKRYRGILEKGTLTLVTAVSLSNDKVSYTVLANGELHSYSDDVHSFLSDHKFEPAGRAMRDAQIREAAVGAAQLANEITTESEQLQGIDQIFRPKALPGVDIEATPEDVKQIGEVPSMALVPVEPGPSTLELAKEWIGNVAEKRNSITLKKTRLHDMQRNVEAMLEEQKKWMQAITCIKDIAKKLNEVINTLNLYLGSGEEIVQLTNGESAPRDIPLTVRQLVLFMDEECALATDEGGIDGHTIEQFDTWLTEDPAHLNQILPEVKGVVCLKPRRNMKDYSENAEVNARMNEANRETYILIRNGENLFRVCPPWGVRKFFFPTKTEFDNIFTEWKRLYKDEAIKLGIDVSDWTEDDNRFGGRNCRVPVAPGSEKFNELMEDAEGDMAYYSKALIMLQGIIDRTGIFPEFQEIGLNLIDVTQWTDFLRFVHDADPSFLLTTGRETFSQFMNRQSENLQPGDRVIGLLNDLEHSSSRYDGESRISPKNASNPDDMKLYTIEGRQGQGWKILYDRTDRVGRYKTVPSDHPNAGKPVPNKPGYVYVTHVREWVTEVPKTRASFQLRPGDDGIITFDRITLEEIEYFLNDRLSRHDYLRMFELLKRVRSMKREEREQEEPFITLCVGEAMKRVPELTEGEIRPQVIKALQWYKYKNKVHRAISDDYAKAVKMVVDQWHALYQTQDSMADDNIKKIMDQLRTDKTLAIFMRKNYVSVIDRVSDDKVFVSRRDYYPTKKGFTMYEEKTHTTVGNWFLGWEQVYKVDDWDTWPKGSRADNDFLTPTEYANLFRTHEPQLRQFVIDCAIRDRWNSAGEPHSEVDNMTLVAVIINASRRVTFYYQMSVRKIGAKRGENTTAHVSLKWARTPEGVVRLDRKGDKFERYNSDHSQSDGADHNLKSNYRKLAQKKSWDPSEEKAFVTYYDAEAIDKFIKADKAAQDSASARRDLKYFMIDAANAVKRNLNGIYFEEAKQRYLANHGDPLLWDKFSDSKKAGVKEAGDEQEFISEALQSLAGSGKLSRKDIYDLTLAQVRELLESKGKVLDQTKWDNLISLGIDPDMLILKEDPERLKREEAAEAAEVEEEDLEETDETGEWDVIDV